MAWITRIVSLDQVEYRLTRGAGCWGHDPHASTQSNTANTSGSQPEAPDHAGHPAHLHPAADPDDPGTRENDPALAYRLASERPLRWVGGGLADLGLTAGAELSETDLMAARALMNGVHPGDGSVLTTLKQQIDPAAKLSARPLLAAIRRAHVLTLPGADQWDDAQIEQHLARHAQQIDQAVSAALPSAHTRALYGQITRNAPRRGDLYVLPAHELEHLAEVTGVDAVSVYGDDLARAYETGYEHRRVRADRHGYGLVPKKVTVGVRGFDVAMTFPKGHSILLAFFPEHTATEYEAMLDQVVLEGLGKLEEWAAYAQRGKHGRDAQGKQHTAEKVATSGLLGWIAVHRSARPVDGAPVGDPHWHVHATFANLGRAEDGKWSAIGSGGRDLFRHARAFDALVQARARYEARERFGIRFERNARGVWDIAEIPEEALRLFSKRDAQVRELFERLNLSYDQASLKARKAASAATREAKNTTVSAAGDDLLRAYWQREAREAGHDVEAIAQRVLSGEGQAPRPTLEEIAALVYDPEHGLTSHNKRFDWADLYAAVLDTLPGGVPNAQAADELAERILEFDNVAVQVHDRVPGHMTHPHCYTTQDVIDAERGVLALARAGYGAGYAVVPQHTAEAALAAFQQENGFELSGEQRACFYRAVRGGHQLDAVIGVAGAGKTTVMSAVRRAFEAAGLVVEGTSTAAVAVDNLRRTAGLGTARTIASYLQGLDADRAPLAGVDVLMIDEAAMCDDRDMARLLAHAADSGTKVIGIGDPSQLRSPGIGGTFAAVHRIVDGVTLADNRRQRDPAELAAMAQLRARDYPGALTALAEHGRVQVGRTRDDARAAVLLLWQQARAEHPDPHDQIEHILVMAATNADVNALNAAARALRRDAGELPGPDTLYHPAGGDTLELTVGDIVLVRRNDYKSHTQPDAHDVYNGTRAVIDHIDEHRNLTVSWRETQPDGTVRTVTETLDAAFVLHGGVSHGIAITGHKSQGLTCSVGITYGDGMRGNATYEAATRGREQNYLIYSQEAYEDETTRLSLGEPDSLEQLTARTIAAVAAELADDQDEDLVSVELGLEELPEQQGPERRRPAAPREPDFELDAMLSAVPELWPLLDRITADPAAADLAARLAALHAHGTDVPAVLRAITGDPQRPLAATHSPAAALIWRLDHHRAASGAPAQHAAPASSNQRLETWVRRAAATTNAPPRLAALSDEDLEAALHAARTSAHDTLARYHQAETDLERLRRQIQAGDGPAARRVKGRYANLRGRGEALEQIAALARQARPLRTELDTLRALPDPTPADLAHMADLRSRLTGIAAESIALDNLAGAPRPRERILAHWQRIRAAHPDNLAAAADLDARRLATAELRVPRLRDASRRAATRYAETLTAARSRGLDVRSPAARSRPSRPTRPRPRRPTIQPRPGPRR